MRGFHLSCIFSKIGTIMSNLGLFAGSSFMHIFMSLQMCGEMPGGIMGLKPSKATYNKRKRVGPKVQEQKVRGKEMDIYEVICVCLCKFNLLSFTVSDLHANFHVGQISKRDFSGHQLPQQDGKAPHVSRPSIDVFWLLLQRWEPQRKPRKGYTENAHTLHNMHSAAPFSA